MNLRMLDPRDRRIVIIASPERAQKLYSLSLLENTPSLFLPFFPLLLTEPLLKLLENSPFIEHKIIGTLGYKVYRYKVYKKLKKLGKPLYPIFDLKTARDQFRFPIGHPVDGTAYACCEEEPDLYVPLASFHRYMYEAKLMAFHELCANLGVRRCIVVYAEEDGQDITMKTGLPKLGIISGTLSVGISEHSNETVTVFAEYPPPNSPIVETHNRWMNGEPTWMMMQKLRLKQNLQKWRVEFSYVDEMGINAEVAAKLVGFGINIGGNFEKMHRRKWIFDVEFWPIKT